MNPLNRHDIQFERDTISSTLSAITNTLDRYGELTSQNKWEGRTEFKDFEGLSEQIEKYSNCANDSFFVSQSRLTLRDLFERFMQMTSKAEEKQVIHLQLVSIENKLNHYHKLNDGRIKEISKNTFNELNEQINNYSKNFEINDPNFIKESHSTLEKLTRKFMQLGSVEKKCIDDQLSTLEKMVECFSKLKAQNNWNGQINEDGSLTSQLNNRIIAYSTTFGPETCSFFVSKSRATLFSLHSNLRKLNEGSVI